LRAKATGAILAGATLLGFSAIFVKWAVAGGGLLVAGIVLVSRGDRATRRAVRR
jgi:hypothetical protein